MRALIGALALPGVFALIYFLGERMMYPDLRWGTAWPGAATTYFWVALFLLGYQLIL